MAEPQAWCRRWSLALGQKGVGFLAGAVLLAILLLFMKMEKSCVTIQSMGSPPCEQVWEQTRKSYEAYIGLLREKEIERSSKIAAWNGKTAYDMYEPEWVCDSEKRVGPGEINFGDGPKFVCGPDLLRDQRDCLVYSIGSNYDFSFEDGMRKYGPGCEFHTFDGTLNLSHRALPSGLKEKNIYFHNWNVHSSDGTHENGWLSKSIKTILSELGHTGKTIHVFKIDCEGCEYSVLPELMEMVKGNQINVQQIQVEIHGTDATKIQHLFQALRDVGYAVFHKERNHWGCNGYKCVEYALISMGHARKVFIESHCLNSQKY